MDHFAELRNYFFRSGARMRSIYCLESLAVRIGHTILAFVDPKFTTRSTIRGPQDFVRGPITSLQWFSQCETLLVEKFWSRSHIKYQAKGVTIRCLLRQNSFDFTKHLVGREYFP